MKELIERIVKFRDDRNWKQFHTPDNLAKSIVIEAGELLENYQWKNDSFDIDNIKDELADVLIYSILLCEHYDFDMKDIISNKLSKNETKYPVEKAFGKSDKYNKL